MNRLRETPNLTSVARWQLAAAYRLAGLIDAANDLVEGDRIEIPDYTQPGFTFGSNLRDRAIILDMLVLFERWREADAVAEELALALSSSEWHSTQTTGFALLAMGKYLQALEDNTDETPVMKGRAATWRPLSSNPTKAGSA